MNRPTNIRRSVDDINYQDKLYALQSACEQQNDKLKDEFFNLKPEPEELPAPKNPYDKIIGFCSSWGFVFIFLALLSTYVMYSILHYWFL